MVLMVIGILGQSVLLLAVDIWLVVDCMSSLDVESISVSVSSGLELVDFCDTLMCRWSWNGHCVYVYAQMCYLLQQYVLPCASIMQLQGVVDGPVMAFYVCTDICWAQK